MGIHINHLGCSVVGGGEIFVSDIAVLRKRIERRIKVLCSREKIASAGMIKIGFQALLYLFCLEHLDYLFSLDDIPVRSVDTESVYCLMI